jgi:hypothetical protein
MSAAADETPERSDNPLRTLVAALVLIEAALPIGGAVVALVNTLTSTPDNAAFLLSLAAIGLVLGAGLAVCARGVLRGLRWARGPVLTWQLLQAGVAMPLSTSSSWWAGVPLLAVSIVVGVLIAGKQVIPQTSDRF